MKYEYIDQAFIDNLPTPTDKIKAEYRADNLPKGFRIEIRNTSKGIGTYRFRTKDKDHHLGRTNTISLEQALQQTTQLIPSAAPPHNSLLPPIVQTPPTCALTLNEFWEQYYWPHIKTRLRTFRNIESMWRLRIKPIFGKQRLDDIKVLELERFQTSLIEKRLSGSHVTGHIKLISRMFTLAIQWELITKNPCDKVEYMKFDNQKERFLSTEEQKRFIEVLMLHPQRPVNLLMIFLLVTGVRSGVAKALKWSWINMDKQIITVPPSIAKNKKQNTIFLNTTAMDILKRLAGTDPTYVFINPMTHLPYNDFKKSFKTALKAAQISDSVRIHDLRHTFCSNLVSSNVSLASVQQLANHACYSTTLRYAKVSQDTLRQACQIAAIEI
ncbi:site-specific integrase [Glaciecola sp. HTCC2999]|uniref:tyrosine-type recombinase/integrase n=1 Tax=Glaciecola sp. HTCC2999 TaxID=455436 RepID=UPI0000E0E62B|nr:site-specific integrase [Glaciecola sp. HTCC2999]